MKIRYFLFLIICLLPSFAESADPNQSRLTFASIKVQKVADTQLKIASLKEELITAHRTPVGSRSSKRSIRKLYPDLDTKRNDISRIKSQIADAETLLRCLDSNDINALAPIFALPFEVNQIGRFGDVILSYYKDTPYVHPQTLKIISIIDKQNVIVEFSVTAEFRDNPGPRESRTLVGIRNGRYIPVTKSIWLRGVSTVGLVTDKRFTPQGIFMITGTQDYQSVIGSKETVFVFEPLEIPPGFQSKRQKN